MSSPKNQNQKASAPETRNDPWHGIPQDAIGTARLAEADRLRHQAGRVMWRLKLTAHMCDNVYYLRKYTSGNVQLVSKGLQLHALSNICQNAFEFETALEDAYTGFDAASATRKHATYIKSVEII